jgi:hypothetical protein
MLRRGLTAYACGNLTFDGAEGETNTKLIYSSDDPRPALLLLLERCGGNVETVVTTLTAPPCSYKMARQMADAFADCLGITAVEFVRIYSKAYRLIPGSD